MKLHSAAEKNDVKKLQELLDAGQPVDKRDPTGDTALLTAAEFGKEKAFFFLLERGADPKAVGYNKESVLHRAASKGKEAMVKALLERGADPNLLCSYPEMMEIQPGMTPFHSALFNDHFAIAELLLEKGADINAKLEDGRTALELVEDLEDRKMSKWLRAHGATPNPIKEAMKGTTTDLHKAAKKGKVEQIRQCLQKGHKVDERDPEGWTALMHAAENAELDAFRELLAAKADPNAANLQGRTVFHCIMKAGIPGMARAWIDAGGNVNHKADVSGLTPLMLTAMKKNAEIMRMLLEAGADLKAKDAQGHSAATWAKKFGTPEIIALLKEWKAGPPPAKKVTPGAKGSSAAKVTAKAFFNAIARDDLETIRAWIAAGNSVNVRDDGVPALTLAALEEKWKAFHELLAAGANPNAVDKDEFSVLFWTVLHDKALKALLLMGADVNYQTPSHGYTALMRACRIDRPSAVRLLIEAGADPHLKDHEGKTALSRVEETNNKKLLAYLKEQMKATPPARVTVPTEPQERGKRLCKAAIAGDVKLIRKLLQAGAAVDFREENGYTSLMLALRHNHLEAYQALLAAGADIHAVGPRGNNILMLAAQYGTLPQVQYLVNQGADVNFQRQEEGDDGYTPLMGAAMAGQQEIVQFLLEAGAQVEAKDREGKTAYDWARGLWNKEVARLLKAKMQATAGEEGQPAAPTKPAGESYQAVRAIVKGFPAAAAQPAFQQLLRQLTDWCGRAPEPWRSEESGMFKLPLKKKNLVTLAAKLQMEPLTFDEDDEVEDAHRLEQLLARLQEEVRKTGFLLVQADLIGIGSTSQQLRLFPTDDPYAVIAASGTNGNRMIEFKGRQDFLSAKYIIAWLRRLAREYPFDLVQCGKDFVGGIFRQPPAQVKKLARRMYDFCPDIVDQGTETVDNLAREIKATQAFYLWWD